MRLASTCLACAFGLAVVGSVAVAPAAAQDYQTITIAKTSVNAAASIGGKVVPFKEVTLSAQIPGQILFVGGGEGDEKTQGELLVRIDDDDLQAQRRAALAEYNHAEATLRNAQVQYNREMWSPSINNLNRSNGMGMPMLFDQMFTRNFGSMFGNSNGSPWVDRYADLSNRYSNLNQAQSRLMSSRAQIELLDAKLRDAMTMAPFDGVIVEKLVEPGDTVQPGQPLIKFAHTKYLRIQAEVPVRLVGGLSVGMIVPAQLDVHSEQIKARVARIYPMADSSRHTVTVKFDLPLGVAGGPGMYAEVKVPDTGASREAQIVVPKSAIIWRGSLPGIFVMKGGKPSLRLVRLGQATGNDHISILAGAHVGDEVLVNPPAAGARPRPAQQ
jgi:multidrug efflux pump subunit AcrA (membrane-fusion protein)